MPFKAPDILGAMQRGREFKARNTLNDLAVQQAQNKMAQDRQLSSTLAELSTVAPEDRNQYLGKLASMGQEGMDAASQLQSIFGKMDATQRAEKLQKAQEISGMLAGVKDQSTYDYFRNQAISENPQMEQHLPPTYDPGVVTVMSNKFRTVQQVLGGSSTDPGSVREYKFRQSLPGGIGGDADQEFLKGKRQQQFLNRGDVYTNTDTGEEFNINPKVSETPQYKAAVSQAVEQAKVAVQKKVQQASQNYKLVSASRIYNNLKQADLDKIYGYGERWYPEFLRSQTGIDLLAQRDQLVSMLQLASAGELKGQGTVTDSERTMLANAATQLNNPTISPEMAKVYLDEAMQVLYRNAGKEFQPENKAPQTPEEWLEQNPDDPRAAKIRAVLNAKKGQ